MEKLWVIGDIHGYSLALKRLLERIAPQKEDTVVTLGDYIDRGPDACGVIECLLDLQEKCHCVTLRGNHEEMLLSILFREVTGNFSQPGMAGFLKKAYAYLRGRYEADMVSKTDWLMLGGRQTLLSYGYDVRQISQIPKEHLDFLQKTELYYETEHHLFAHAAYVPDLPMDEQPRQTLLFHRLKHSVPKLHFSGKKCYVGHSAQHSGEILDLDHIVCIDTCLYGGGWLTAVEVHSGMILQVDSSGTLR